MDLPCSFTFTCPNLIRDHLTIGNTSYSSSTSPTETVLISLWKSGPFDWSQFSPAVPRSVKRNVQIQNATLLQDKTTSSPSVASRQKKTRFNDIEWKPTLVKHLFLLLFRPIIIDDRRLWLAICIFGLFLFPSSINHYTFLGQILPQNTIAFRQHADRQTDRP